MESCGTRPSLTNREALEKLIACIEEEIKSEASRLDLKTSEDLSKTKFPFKTHILRETLLGLGHSVKRKSSGLLLCWRLQLTGWIFIVAIFASSLTGEPDYPALASSLCFAFLLLLNLLLSSKIEKWRRTEPLRKAEILLAKLKITASDPSVDTELSTPDLFLPSSECINLQWTYRGGKLVNIPWILLVEGDLILARPGREAPSYCRELENSDKSFGPGETVLLPEQCEAGEAKPMEPVPCIITQTPVLPFLQTCFHAPERPVGVLDNELYKCCHEFLEIYILPFGIFISICLGIFRYLVYPEAAGDLKSMILIVPCYMCIPLLGLSAPLINFAINARNQTLLHAQTNPEGSSNGNLLFVNESEEKKFRYGFKRKFESFMKFVTGNPSHLTYSSTPVETLGSVTSVSVVDKKGILSWPNPTAERIFFVRNAEQLPTPSTFPFRRDSCLTGLSPEIMNLSHDPSHAFAVSFDDPSWNQALPNLKPLGLNMMLNSCKLDEDYVQFVDHIHVVSEFVPRTIPVVSRRCCCHLAESIGFTSTVIEDQFKILKTLAGYKKQPGQAALPGLTKHRTPFPNMFGAVVEENKSLQRHLLAQGTADLLLDLCTHCWAGGEVAELPKSLRRKIADFYHRNSMTSYCVAFSYSPYVSDYNGFDSYIEWPVDSRRSEAEKLKSLENSPYCTPRGFQSSSFSLHSLNPTDLEQSKDSPNEQKTIPFDHQIFLGMITLQYQAKPDVVQLVELLDKACIRFVHFSKENELRSRGFAEKMGLESGWNCHISLASEGSLNITADKPKSTSDADNNNMSTEGQSNEMRERLRSCSVPGNLKYFTQDSKKEDFGDDVRHREKLESSSEAPLAFVDEFIDEAGVEIEKHEDSPLLTDPDDSVSSLKEDVYIRENRAQLPKGIENVRPHLEKVDNVPLLVSLFTDCSHESTREMIEIMQDNGEVVLAIGSSVNANSADIFSQANGSIAMEPLQPVSCIRAPSQPSARWDACQISSWIYSLPCLMNISQINLLAVLGHSRHCLSLVRSSLLFYSFGCFSLYAVQALAMALLLPPIMSLSQLAMFLIIHLPVLSFSLIASPVDIKAVLQETTTRNEKWLPGKKAWKFFGLGFLTKFLPSVIVAVILFGAYLIQSCYSFPDSNCKWFINANRSSRSDYEWGGFDTTYSSSLSLGQNLSAIALTLYFCAIASTFTYPSQNFWAHSPLRNRTWIATCIVILGVQCLYCFATQGTYKNLIHQVPGYVWAALVAWVVPAIVIAELYKRKEIVVYRREQRRRRLSFGTKLGLNSPF